jgi:ligand-binding sensor domain-containing protein
MPLLAQTGTWKTYMAYNNVQQIQAAGNELFVMASNNLYVYNKQDQSIRTFDKTKGLSDTEISYIKWCPQSKRLVIVYSNSNIDLMDLNGNVRNISDLYHKSMTGSKQLKSIYVYGQYAYLCCGFGIVKLNVKDAEISESYIFGFQINQVVIEGEKIYAMDYYGRVYMADMKENLIDNSNWKRVNTYPSFSETDTDYADNIELVKTLKPGGPNDNHFAFMRFKHGRLYTCGGGYTATKEMDIPVIIQILHGDEWTCFTDTINKITGWKYCDMLTLDADPNDPEHVFAGGRTGLYEYRSGQFVKAYNVDNSPLASAISDTDPYYKTYVLVEGLMFDKNGKLWVLNSSNRAFKSLLEYDPKNEQWTDHHEKLLENGSKSLKALLAPYQDSRGYIWFVNAHWEVPSIYCYDPESNKIINYFRNLVNQDGSTVTNYCPYEIEEDLEGNIWIATNEGPFVVEKDNITTMGTNVTQIKVPRNDGTNYADYLLSGVITYCMAIDGGGRKWFGTLGNGVYVISADNMTQVEHFTTSNSSILSDNIESIAINHATGEVFIGTDKGLCSYMSDASTSNEEMTKDNVWAYPNPVTPDYTGLITITGLSFNADVKILNASGKLIVQGRSNGGSFTWNGCDKDGNRVGSGIYMVAAATKDGNKGTVCKIAVVK